MKRENWQTFYAYGQPDELDAARLRWLCGCGQSVAFLGSKAYPICQCGQRMRILDEPSLGYVRTGAAATA